MTVEHPVTRASLPHDELLNHARLVMAGALGVVHLKLASMRLMTDASQSDVVQDTEQLERKAKTWFDGTRSHFEALSDAALALRDAGDLDAAPPPDDGKFRLEWLRREIEGVAIEIIRASEAVRSYERDPVFTYLHGKHAKASSKPLGWMDRRLSEASLYDYNAGRYLAALRYTAAAERWLAAARAETDVMEALSRVGLERDTDREGAMKAAIAHAREVATSAAGILVSAVDRALTDFLELDEEVNCLVARERAASRVKAMMAGAVPEPMPLERQQEQNIAAFEKALATYRETASRIHPVSA